MLLLVIAYPLVLTLLPTLSPRTVIAVHFAHACVWCIFHCFGLGLLLRAQSESKFIVGHFLKNYHYPPNDGGKGAIQEAFTNWKTLYNLSLCMTYSTSSSISNVLDLTNSCANSFVYWTGLEDVLNSERLDSG